MFVAGTNLTETRLFTDSCLTESDTSDETDDASVDSNLCEDIVIKTSRIQLQFDERDDYM